MFGCGKFDEVKMLGFLEGKKDEEVEQHLKTCDICLKELVELNRVNSEMDYADVKLFKSAKTIVLEAVKDKVVSFFSNLSNPQLVEVGVRKGEESQKALFQSNFDSFIIKIFPEENETFWVSVLSEKNKIFNVELYEKDDKIPLFSKINANKEVIIKNLKSGSYRLKINREIIYVNMDFIEKKK